MRKTSAFFLIILIFWIGFSTYWYVCKIKNDCEKETSFVDNQQNIDIKETNTEPITDSIQKNNKKSEPIDNLKENFEEELLKGYTINNFSKNSGSNNKIKSDFNEFANLLAEYLENNKDSKVQITGYTDNTGSKQANIIFGKKRANFVKQLLIDKGIDKQFFIIQSKGEADAIASNDTEEGRLKNRRVLIKLIKN